MMFTAAKRQVTAALKAKTALGLPYVDPSRAVRTPMSNPWPTPWRPSKSPPGPQSVIVDNLIRGLERLRDWQRTWRERYPQEPWSAELEEMDQALATIQDLWGAIAQRVHAAHRQWIGHHVEAFPL